MLIFYIILFQNRMELLRLDQKPRENSKNWNLLWSLRHNLRRICWLIIKVVKKEVCKMTFPIQFVMCPHNFTEYANLTELFVWFVISWQNSQTRLNWTAQDRPDFVVHYRRIDLSNLLSLGKWGDEFCLL